MGYSDYTGSFFADIFRSGLAWLAGIILLIAGLIIWVAILLFRPDRVESPHPLSPQVEYHLRKDRVTVDTVYVYKTPK